MASRYHEVYENWKRDPEAFWAAAAEDIDWFKRWDKVFDPDAGRLWPLVHRRASATPPTIASTAISSRAAPIRSR